MSHWIVMLFRMSGLIIFVITTASQSTAETPVTSRLAERLLRKPLKASGNLSEVRQSVPSFLVAADVNHSTRSYREGDFLSVQVISERDAFVHVFYQQADGKTFQIFPNVRQSNNRLKAGVGVQIPAAGDLFSWKIGAPFGDEVIKVIASEKPLDALADPALSRGRFNPVGVGKIKGIEVDLSEPAAPVWAECEVKINTRPRDAQELARGAKRVGMFFGVSEYRFNSLSPLKKESNEHSLNLNACHLDARAMAKLLKEIGQLGEVKIFTNRDATRDAMEYAITRWAPSVTVPGDTVVIHFSGHGGQISDLDDDEEDHEDEFLLTHEFCSVKMLKRGEALLEKGLLLPELESDVRGLLKVMKNFKPPEEFEVTLIQKMSVTDDQLGHWIQSLSGRQVVILVDACHSGGLSPQEKGGRSSFRFLTREVARLKDLGQRETALLAACKSHETTFDGSELGLMTESVVTCLRNSREKVSVEEVHKFSTEFIRDAIIKKNANLPAGETPYEVYFPVLLNLCSEPVYFKP